MDWGTCERILVNVMVGKGEWQEVEVVLHRKQSDLLRGKCVGLRGWREGGLVRIVLRKKIFKCPLCQVSAEYFSPFHAKLQEISLCLFIFSSPSLLKTTFMVVWHLCLYSNDFQKKNRQWLLCSTECTLCHSILFVQKNEHACSDCV